MPKMRQTLTGINIRLDNIKEKSSELELRLISAFQMKHRKEKDKKIKRTSVSSATISGS